LDRIDGGFSLLIRCPGQLPETGSLQLNNTQLKAYLPPREVEDYATSLETPISNIVNIFRQDIAEPHMQ